jgi:hypothetical protein
VNWVKRHDLTVFLILAFALSWWIWPFMLVNPESTPLVPFGPWARPVWMPPVALDGGTAAGTLVERQRFQAVGRT